MTDWRSAAVVSAARNRIYTAFTSDGYDPRF
jgi:hypothetical protein